MKKFNLLKSLCAVLVTVAMLASLGTVAFAAPGAYAPTDNSVKITDITCTAKSATLYTVTVKCEISDDAMDKNAIGVTMLTYAKKDEGLNADASGYTAYDDTMQIVGIDQKQREDGANTVEFSFAVTTDDNDGANAYAVQPGKSAVILVSGDGLNPAAGLLTIEKQKTPATATSATVAYDGALDIYSYDTTDTILAALKDNFEATDAVVSDASGDLGTVAVDPSYITSVAKKDDTTYTATAVIPTDAVVESDDYNVTIASAITVTFDVAVNLTAWAADTVEADFETAFNTTVSSVVDADAVKALIVGKKIKVSKSDVAAATDTVVITDDMITAAAENPTEIAEGAVFNYTVAVSDTDEYTVPAESEIAVAITIIADPSEPFDITEVVVNGSYTAAYTGAEGESKDDVVATVIEDLTANTGLTVTVKGANGEVETWNIDESSWAHTGENGDKCVFAADIVAPADALGVNASDLKAEIEIEITVTGDPVFLGDVTLDGKINLSDVNALKFHVNGKKTNEAIADESSVSFAAANITGDAKVNLSDVNALKFHVNGKKTNSDIGTKQVGVKPVE